MTHDDNTLPHDSGTSQAFQQRQLGDFLLLSELGRGGMGVVYLARQISLNREVAVKVLSSNLGLTNKAVARFRREAESAARLHHTNIVPVYATGEEDNILYYAMERIDGPSLDIVLAELAQQGSPSSGDTVANQSLSDATPSGLSGSSLSAGRAYFDTVALMIAGVADALEHAHEQGIVHRDIKPSNLLVSPQGRLSVNDFGLARVLEQPGMTITGEMVGTPRYMSPEQIAVGRVPIDHRTDIFSLGVTLYELLTLQPPFGASQRDELLAQILQKEPLPPRKLNPKAPVDLETICLKAMEKDPDRRYATAGQMADDLRRYVNRFAILARRIGPLGRIKKWTKRNPALSTVLAATVVCGLAAMALGYNVYFVQPTKRAEAAAKHYAELLEEQRKNAMNRALVACRLEDFERAEAAILEAEQLECSPGQIRMLRGQQELFKGNPQRAIDHLEKAVDLLHDSIAAWSMLATAYTNDGQITNYNESLAIALSKSSTDSDDYDYLFLGLAQSFLDPQAGLDSINQAVRFRSSLLTRMVRAEVLHLAILDTPDLEQTQILMDDMQSVKRNEPESVMLLVLSAKVHLSCYLVFDHLGETELRQIARDRGREDAKKLAQYEGSDKATVARWVFLEEVGEEQPIDLADLRRASANNANAAAYAGAYLYREGEFAQAYEEFNKNAERNMHLMLALAAIETPHGAKVLRSIESANSNNPPQDWNRFNAQLLLRLQGKLEDAIEESKQFLKQPDDFPPVRQDEFRLALEYCADNINAEELVQSLHGRRGDLCNAYFCIALTKLAEGDCPEAVRYLEKSRATQYYEFTPYQVSGMLLSRLQQDPDWRPWIQPGTSAEK